VVSLMGLDLLRNRENWKARWQAVKDVLLALQV
jgi:hypothetical protein